MRPPTTFTPLVTFSYGREGKKFRDFVKFIGATYVHQKFGIDASDDSGMRLRQRVINNIWRRSSCAMMRGNCEVLKQGEYRIYHAQRHLPARDVGSSSNLLIRPSTWHCLLERIQARFTINCDCSKTLQTPPQEGWTFLGEWKIMNTLRETTDATPIRSRRVPQNLYETCTKHASKMLVLIAKVVVERVPKTIRIGV